MSSKSAATSESLLDELQSRIGSQSRQLHVRGQGLMAGVDLRLANGAAAGDAAMKAIKEMLRRGFILLPEGEHGNVISFTPPLTITKAQLGATVEALKEQFEI